MKMPAENATIVSAAQPRRTMGAASRTAAASSKIIATSAITKKTKLSWVLRWTGMIRRYSLCG